MLRPMVMRPLPTAVVAVYALAAACTGSTAANRSDHAAPALHLDLTDVTFACESGNSGAGPHEARPAVTAEVPHPRSATLFATVTADDGSTLGQGRVVFAGGEPAVAFSVLVDSLNVPGARLALRDAQHREVGAATVAFAPAQSNRAACSPRDDAR
jgi:hypothetical protein